MASSVDLSTDEADGISQVSQERSTKQDGDCLSEVQGSCLHRMNTHSEKTKDAQTPTDASPRSLPVQGCGVCLSPVLGLVTWQSSCMLFSTGQAAGVGQEKVYSQSCTALMNRGLEF